MRKLQIQVLTRDGRKNIFETDRFGNVADLKKRIGRSLNVPMTFSKLTYKGRLLPNDSILEDEGVKRLSTLELYWQPLVLTPKQFREKELELEKLEQKQRHLSRLADNCDAVTATAKKTSHERPSAAARQLPVKHSISDGDVEMLAAEPMTTEEHKSETSEELDFLAVYWCCHKKTRLDSQTKLKQQPPAVAEADLIANVVSKHSCASLSTSLRQTVFEGEPQPLAGVLENRSLCWKPSFRQGVRLAAGRMSQSIISNIRKHQQNCKK